jgi:uncharacterized membrane protein
MRLLVYMFLYGSLGYAIGKLSLDKRIQKLFKNHKKLLILLEVVLMMIAFITILVWRFSK